MRPLPSRTSLVAAATGLALAAGLAVATPASAAGSNYMHTTHASKACLVHGNLPKTGVDKSYGWRVAKGHALPVRYTVGKYTMVIDRSRKHKALHWGFIAKSCLVDPYAYDTSKHRLKDRRGVGGDGKVKKVVVAPKAGHGRKTLHVSSAGTLRNAPKSFVIGNVRAHETFVITKASCGHHGSSAWIFGHDKATGRWGYVQSKHLPACR
ncbi:hypothetical protein SAMN05443575_1707 [Jatrophihabitans endophyticus]|uniref:SH3 domain-containing protein n=1 Tax=Jatrophihabitans endophyticus TaxID=1206085 RepID=A0A1M5I071_9ACTN|nr:hypothetical protein [Jatrophihabitans endophyticus]SHG21704.1 hypothetical protein SAMN05443575_1707 [Jatrophihabitans endophyticus]